MRFQHGERHIPMCMSDHHCSLSRAAKWPRAFIVSELQYKVFDKLDVQWLNRVDGKMATELLPRLWRKPLVKRYISKKGLRAQWSLLTPKGLVA